MKQNKIQNQTGTNNRQHHSFLRVICVVAALALLTSIATCFSAGAAVNTGSMKLTQAQAKACDSTLYCTADDFVALRKSASSASAELARIPHGCSMTYLNYKTGKWYYVKYGCKKGYVYSDYVSYSKPSSKSQSGASTLYCTADDFVALRKRATSASTELARIPRGCSMTYLNYKTGKWYYVKYGSQKGYVYSDYVSYSKPSSSCGSQSQSGQSGAGILYCTADDFVSLRISPSAKSTELVKIQRGEKMGYLNKRSGKWLYVQYGSKKGYVYSDYVSTVKPK